MLEDFKVLLNIGGQAPTTSRPKPITTVGKREPICLSQLEGIEKLSNLFLAFPENSLFNGSLGFIGSLYLIKLLHK